jgi:hypothetical protein
MMPVQATEVTRPRQVTWREHAIEIVIIAGSLLNLLPAMLIYGLLAKAATLKAERVAALASIW